MRSVASMNALFMAAAFSGLCVVGAYATSYVIDSSTDEGTEVNRTEWFENGIETAQGDPINYLGRSGSDVFDAGFRFTIAGFGGVNEIAHARLRFSSAGSDIDSAANLAISGVLQSDATTFSLDSRPSQKQPRTSAAVDWTIDRWIDVNDYSPHVTLTVPLFYRSPDVSGIINEFTSTLGMSDPQPFIFVIEEQNSPSGETNLVYFDGYREFDPTNANQPLPVTLEVYPTVYDTFIGKELMGRVTDSSAVVALYSLIDTDVYVQYGVSPGLYAGETTPLLGNPGEAPIQVEITDLQADTEYYYRLACRRAGAGDYEFADEHSFHTQRPRGSAFRFSVTADEHLQNMMAYPQTVDDMALYRRTLENVAAADPDFWISLGDFAHTEFLTARDVVSQDEAVKRYLDQRDYIDRIGHSIPFYLVIGNHEGEQGWYYDFDNPGSNGESLAVWSTIARKQIIANPQPNGFYTGNNDVIPEFGLRGDYYAWEWGDALFVVIDPYWYTKANPGNDWNWTLGEAQYEWLYQTLHGSDAKWKFVFTHQLTSSYNAGQARKHYGRGGIEVAKYKVASQASYEWGGENVNGDYVFDVQRPGWSHGAIHDMLVAEGVNVLFHGHDHGFAKQDLDGIVYLECPKPGASEYSLGFLEKSGYTHGDLIANSGHIEVSVAESHVRLDYVRAYLPGDGENGETAYTTFIGVTGDVDHDGDVDLADLATFLSHYQVGPPNAGDIDGDGDTDVNDLYLLLENYGADYSE